MTIKFFRKIIKNTRKKKSSVWSFFIKTPKGGEYKLCTKNIAAPGNTTNLKNHLKRSHYESYSIVFADLSVNDRFEDGVEINSNKKDLNTQSKTFNSEQQRILIECCHLKMAAVNMKKSQIH
ncbi:uncharacterized protein LOC141525956 isoform X1 [Cotesia typhae]|uniref:uncharacterized protein LOC141525956 isoform X1 n=1 Tax=Cotesia typhae TaxID=2053667 RepID=UPI003D6999D9